MGIELWEKSLAIRDSVFGQIFLIVLGAYIVYRLLARPVIKLAVIVALGLFVGLYVFSLMHITLWTP